MRRRRGFTLPELLVAMTLLLLVGGGAVNMVLSTYRSLRSQREITTTEDALRILEQTINTVLRAAAANPMRITGSTLGVPRLEGITSTVASQCLGVRAISDLNADRVMTGPLEFVEIQHRSSDETIQFRSSSAGTAETAADLIKTLRFEFLTATGVAVNCATSMSTARHVRVTLEARRRAGSDQLITRQWLVHLRNFQ
jgi:prepilin-type N-terminal cleavage/methylation domain-containing protein